jgi:hypothetical protein
MDEKCILKIEERILMFNKWMGTKNVSKTDGGKNAINE